MFAVKEVLPNPDAGQLFPVVILAILYTGSQRRIKLQGGSFLNSSALFKFGALGMKRYSQSQTLLKFANMESYSRIEYQ